MTDNDKTYRSAKSGKPIALEPQTAQKDRLFSPSVARNKDIIRDTLVPLLVREAAMLEIASGTGEHAAHIAAACPDVNWYPSDPDPASRSSISAWRDFCGLVSLNPPLAIDTSLDQWWARDDLPAKIKNILCINMIHIAPFQAATGLIEGAVALLPHRGRLFFYGPFKREGKIAPSNLDFDTSLKARDPSRGVRDLDLEIIPLAEKNGLGLVSVTDMPANNLMVVFENR